MNEWVVQLLDQLQGDDTNSMSPALVVAYVHTIIAGHDDTTAGLSNYFDTPDKPDDKENEPQDYNPLPDQRY